MIKNVSTSKQSYQIKQSYLIINIFYPITNVKRNNHSKYHINYNCIMLIKYKFKNTHLNKMKK